MGVLQTKGRVSRLEAMEHFHQASQGGLEGNPRDPKRFFQKRKSTKINQLKEGWGNRCHYTEQGLLT